MGNRYRFLGLRVVAMLAFVAMGTSVAHAQLGLKYLPTLSLQKEQVTSNPGGDITNG